MAVNDPHFYERMLSLSACLCGKITEKELPEPCFCGVITGDRITADYCQSTGGKDGMAWVRMVGITEQEMGDVGGANIMSSSHCATPLIADVEVGILRCAPAPGLDGAPPTEGAYLASAQLQMADMNAALEAIRCCFGRKDIRVQGWTPMGPDGGCLGGAWLVSVFEDM